MIKIALLVDNIFDILWLNIVLAMSYIKNRRLVFFLIDINFFETLHKHFSKLLNTHSLESTIYVVKNNKEKNHLKSNTMKDLLIDYDDDTLYRVYLSKIQKIKRVKDLNFYDHKLVSKKNINFDEIFIDVIDDEQREKLDSQIFFVNETLVASKVSSFFAFKSKT